MTNVNAAGRTATASIATDGSATVTLNGTAALAPLGGLGLLNDLVCGLATFLQQFLNDCYQQSISVPIFLLADQSIVHSDTDPVYGWFLRNKWNELTYYAVANKHSPAVAPGRRGCASSCRIRRRSEGTTARSS